MFFDITVLLHRSRPQARTPPPPQTRPKQALVFPQVVAEPKKKAGKTEDCSETGAGSNNFQGKLQRLNLSDV